MFAANLNNVHDETNIQLMDEFMWMVITQDKKVASKLASFKGYHKIAPIPTALHRINAESGIAGPEFEIKNMGNLLVRIGSPLIGMTRST